LGEHGQPICSAQIAGRSGRATEGDQVVDAHVGALAAADAPAWVQRQLELDRAAVRFGAVCGNAAYSQRLGRAHRGASVAEGAAPGIERVGEL